MSEAVAASSAASSGSQVQGTSGGSSNNNNTISMGTSFSSVEQLRIKYPEFYNELLIGMGTTVCQQMVDSQERIKERMREDEDEAASEF